MSEYTPTTAEVRNALRPYRVHPLEFDRWLAEVRAQALTITDEMVERAARVFYKSQTGYDLLHSSGYRNHWLMLSRAALEAAFRENRSSDS